LLDARSALPPFREPLSAFRLPDVLRLPDDALRLPDALRLLVEARLPAWEPDRFRADGLFPRTESAAPEEMSLRPASALPR